MTIIMRKKKLLQFFFFKFIAFPKKKPPFHFHSSIIDSRMKRKKKEKLFSKLFAGTFIQTAIIEKLFATGKCLLCEMNYRKSVLVECPNFKCSATYCKTCFMEIHQQCYACLVCYVYISFI